MATSDGPVRQPWRYLGSNKNWAGLAGAAVGAGLHQIGLGGNLWPGVVAALYGVGALVMPDRRTDPPVEPPAPIPHPAPDPGPLTTDPPTPGPGAGTPSGSASAATGVPAPPPPSDPELEELAAYLGDLSLPPSAGVDALLAALRAAGPGPVTERIVRHRLPLAVAGYLRALTWRPWAGPGAPDPAAELGREVVLLTAELA
ncbi:hypothetical protein ATKI12_3602 [Kitasatospora sp. Ki12]|uniref:hypothetical protein n=1 Tax=Kitasatospora xanthocidica TaxID=83382 RepID=UPI001673120E|nr:hypothetical protein [Kitasatospora xanthocidica]